jgi:flavin reductase (DIM6/NTAB) family NADH-FMN oxidoreductase RutF
VPLDAERFRQVLGAWASGVTIVTSRHGDHVHGMTVSAFCSVSLDPPLVLVCADKASNTHELIARAGVFSVSVLAQGQGELSNRFASKRYEDVRFEGLECEPGATGCPRIPGAFAWLDCSVSQAVDAGDHWIYVGQVEDASLADAEPLLYFRGAYRSFEPS